MLQKILNLKNVRQLSSAEQSVLFGGIPKCMLTTGDVVFTDIGTSTSSVPSIADEKPTTCTNDPLCCGMKHACPTNKC